MVSQDSEAQVMELREQLAAQTALGVAAAVSQAYWSLYLIQLIITVPHPAFPSFAVPCPAFDHCTSSSF